MTAFHLEDAAATEDFGRKLALSLPPDPCGWTILFTGELGAGKSTLVRAMLRALGHEGPVPSPTYTLVEPYEFDDFSAYHVDLYRIGSEDELRFLGWNELDSGLRLVEWPDRAPGLADAADIDVRLAYDGTARRAELVAISDRARDWLEESPIMSGR